MTAYRTIVADPPWDHSDGTGVHVDRGEVTHMPYPPMTLDDIRALPVRDLSDNIGGEAHLYLWTTCRYLPDAFGVARSWGFHYAAPIAWCKPPRGWSTGGAWQNNIEFVLFCRRPGHTRRPNVLRITTAIADAADKAGISALRVDELMGTKRMAQVWWVTRVEHRCQCPSDEQWQKLKAILPLGDELDDAVREVNAAKGSRTAPPLEQATSRWFQWPRTAHSEKPEAFLDLVEQVSPGPYAELFARRARFGWDYPLGDQALGGVAA